EKWYRPGNAALLICGDVDPAALVPMIEKAFAGWKKIENPAPHANHGIPDFETLRAAVVTDPEITQADFSLGTWQPYKVLRTVGDVRGSIVERAGAWMLRRRLRKALQEGKAGYQSATASATDFMTYRRSIDASATCEPAKWKAGARDMLMAVRTARVHGFTNPEWAAAQNAFLSVASRAVRMAPTTRSSTYISQMALAVAQDRPPMSPQNSHDLMKMLLPTITLDEIAAAFRQNYGFDKGMVMLTMPAKEGVAIPDKSELLALVAEVEKADVKKAAEADAKGELYPPVPEPAEVVSRTLDESTGVTTLVLENGAHVHIKRLDTQKDRVGVSVRFLGGVIDETEQTRGLTMAGAVAFQPQLGATKRHSASQLSDALTGKNFRVGANAGGAMLSVALQGSTKEIDEGFRLLHLKLTESRLVQPSLDRFRTQMLQQLQMIATRVDVQANLAVDALLTGNDVRLRIPSVAHIQSIQVGTAQAWIAQVLATAPIEVAIVGDIDVEKAVDLARRFLGALPKRSAAFSAVDKKRKIEINKGPLVEDVRIATITPQSIVRTGWRGSALGARDDHRRLFVLSLLLSTRLNSVVREEKGLTYSIQCAAVPSTDYDGFGQVFAIFVADPKKVDEAAKLSKETMLKILEKPPTDDEMAAVHTQLANMLDEQFKLPQFWMGVLSSITSSGRTPAAIGKLKERYAAVTKDDVLAAAKKYFVEERHFQVIARPK
ncbi:MAG: insulinase family protein, partial [Planctomycetota bacterium]|nr:insulinase family protein [Planctomycetota bacterium]